MRLTLRRPDDWHCHLRDGEMLGAVVHATASDFGRAIAMPNLRPPVVRAVDARAYRQRIEEVVSSEVRFSPLMTGYLTDRTDPDDVAAGFLDGSWVAMKLYPAGATTNSDSGVTSVGRVMPVLERMAAIGMPLLVHGEVTTPGIDIFDREKLFIDEILTPLVEALPRLKVVLEHVTTAHAVTFVEGTTATVAATITPHHLWWNRNALFAGGLRPHAYCLPILKREEDRQALRRAATSDSGRFFLGTDSAPHRVGDKERDCGCAGVFCAPSALAAYATVFEEEGALDRLEAFASLNGPRFYGLEPGSGQITLERTPWHVPEYVQVGDTEVLCFLGGETLPWRVVST
jgi:dihydroorotase